MEENVSSLPSGLPSGSGSMVVLGCCPPAATEPHQSLLPLIPHLPHPKPQPSVFFCIYKTLEQVWGCFFFSF